MILIESNKYLDDFIDRDSSNAIKNNSDYMNNISFLFNSIVSDDLVSELSAGCCYPTIGGTPESHRLNLFNPSYDLTYYGTINHSANGQAGSGSPSYADTNWHTRLLSGGIHTSFYPSVISGSGFMWGSADIDSSSNIVSRGTFVYNSNPSYIAFGRVGLSNNRYRFSGSFVKGIYQYNFSTADNSSYLLKDNILIPSNQLSSVQGETTVVTIKLFKMDAAGVNLGYNSSTLGWFSMCPELTAIKQKKFYYIMYKFQRNLGRL